MKILAYIIINLFLFSSWYALLYQKRAHILFSDRLIGTFVLGLTQIIATEMLLGVVFNSLFQRPLFLLNIFLSVIVLGFALRAGTAGLFREIIDEALRIFAIIRSDLVLLSLFSMFLGLIIWMLFLGYLFPSYTWDALYYHLPIVGQIMQGGAIQENPTSSFIQQYMNIFSKNINLFFLWNIIFLESDIIVDLSQLFFTITGAIAIYSMAVKMKIKEKYAIYSSILFFMTPMIVFQSTANYVDGAVSMLLLIAVNFLLYDDLEHYTDTSGGLRPLKERRVPVVLSGLAAGILLGSKPSGPLFIAVLTGLIFVQELIKYFRPSQAKGYLLKEGMKTYVVYFGLPILIMGGYWYCRNWIFYGNPVYFMDVSVFGHTLMKGLENTWVESSPAIIENLNYITRLFHVWQERVGYYMYDSRFSGFGPIWFILFIPSILFSFIYAVRKKKYSYLLAGTILALTFIVHPRNWTTRYVVFIVGLGAISFGFVLDYFRRRENVLRIVALILAGYTLFALNTPCIMPEKISEFLQLSSNERTLSRYKPFNIDIKVRDEYGIWIWMDNNVFAGDTLAYTFEQMTLDEINPFFIAPLWNNEFSNRVVYVKSDSYNDWLNQLQKNDVTYILSMKGSDEDMWIEKERHVFYSTRWMGNVIEKFEVVYSDGKYKIVKFNTGLKAEG